MSDYPPPVAELLKLGDEESSRVRRSDEFDYRSRGIGPEHIPDLIRMVLDPELNEGDPERPEVWAPLFAIQALGQLRATEAVPVLMQAVKEDLERDGDYIAEEVPGVMGLIGPAALPALADWLRTESLDVYLRWVAINGIESIANEHPDVREECLALLVGQLEKFSENDPTLNGALISTLTDLRAVQAAPLMEQAFAADAVDTSIHGDWEYIRYELGLGPPPVPRPVSPLSRQGFLVDPPGRSPKTRAQERSRNRKKQAKNSKKRNRKK